MCRSLSTSSSAGQARGFHAGHAVSQAKAKSAKTSFAPGTVLCRVLSVTCGVTLLDNRIWYVLARKPDGTGNQQPTARLRQEARKGYRLQKCR